LLSSGSPETTVDVIPRSFKEASSVSVGFCDSFEAHEGLPILLILKMEPLQKDDRPSVTDEFLKSLWESGRSVGTQAAMIITFASTLDGFELDFEHDRCRVDTHISQITRSTVAYVKASSCSREPRWEVLTIAQTAANRVHPIIRHRPTLALISNFSFQKARIGTTPSIISVAAA
jgi:hypothetical protein